MGLFRKYVLSNCYESLYVTLARFNVHAVLQIRVSTGKCYMRILKMHSFVAVQKTFLSKPNIAQRIDWSSNHEF